MRLVNYFLALIFSILCMPAGLAFQAMEDHGELLDQLEETNNYIDEFPDSAQTRVIQVLQESRELKYYDLEAKALSQLALIENIDGNYMGALRLDLLALTAAQSFQTDSLLLQKVYNNIGDDYLEVRNYDKAYENFLNAYQISEINQDTFGMAVTTFNFGLVHKELGQMDEAMDKYQESLKLSEESRDYPGIAYVNKEIGFLHFMSGDYEKANSYYDAAMSGIDSLSIPVLEVDIYTKIALSTLHQEHYEESEGLFQKALGIAEKMENEERQATILNGLATLYMFTDRNTLAENTIWKSIDLSANSRKKEIECESYRILYLIAKKKNDFATALKYYERFHTVKDSLQQVMSRVQLSSLKLQHELDVKDLEITSLNTREATRLEQMQKEEVLRNILMIFMIILVVLLVLVYGSGRKRRKVNNELRLKKAEIERQKDELAELNKVKDKFFSILAHDLRSPIRSLSGVLKLLDSNDLSEAETKKLVSTIGRRTEQTQRLLDNLLEWALIQMEKITVSRSKFSLKEVVEDNIDLVQETSDKPLKINASVNGSVVYADKNMVDLVLRNLLSNAIKYSGDNPRIKISAESENGHVNVHVLDNGVGISKEYQDYILKEKKLINKHETPESKGTGLGLKISREFIERNGGSLWIESEPGKGSKFSFSLPSAETKY